jgi:dTDP-4-amino-4,6-dideoxygalactose transaminase
MFQFTNASIVSRHCDLLQRNIHTIFSFDPVKTVTCIDGGVLIVEGAQLVERLQAMRLIGMTQPVAQMYNNSRAWNYDIHELGFRYH